MNLVNKQVTHKIFGEGTVIQYNDSYIKVSFPSGNKSFVFPEAFGKYLTLLDKRTAKIIDKKVQKRKKELAEEERRLKELKAQQAKKRRLLLERERRSRRLRSRRVDPRSQSVFWCERGEIPDVFANWRVFTGAIKSGQNQGQPRRLARIRPNSACLLTVRDAGEAEKNRRIIGVFMVPENYSNRHSEDGYVPAHPKFKLQLTDKEAGKMLFWNYYLNKRYPKNTTWNTGRHRYFQNQWMAQILRDLVSLKENTPVQEDVQDFFTYFCQMNQINMDELPAPNGALLRG